MEKHIKNSFNNSYLEKASTIYGFDMTTLEEVGGFENLIYSFKKNENKFILRISHSDHHNLYDLNAELEFIQFLKDNNAKVVTPIKSEKGNLVEMLGEKEPTFLATAFKFAKGRAPRREDATKEFFTEYGRVLAEMHKITKRFIPKNRRIEWYEDVLIKDACSYLPENSKVCSIFNELLNELHELPKDKESYGLIHTDMHMGNFFINDELEFEVFDFDDSAYKWFISDIAIVLFYSIWFNPDDLERADFVMKHFMKGYNQVNKLDDSWFSKLNLFLKFRRIILYIVIHRSFDINNLPDWADRYIKLHEENILSDSPFIALDFNQYN
ncbi:phosphotransferase [Mycoplasmatota bacterium]|nr:phosphotransferase [Mycoplasmatota bacterium]